MNPGKLRHRIKFLKRIPGTDDSGELLDAWELYKEAWASKEPLLGNEFFTALTTANKIEVKFNLRYIPGITSEMRIQHGHEVYEIIGPPIDVKSLRTELLCYCRKVT